MRKDIEITEQDIFKFVFFKEELSDDKVAYIENNPDFEEQIKYYESIKDGIDKEISSSFKSMIASKISAYKIEKVFFLYPRKYEKEKSNNEALIYAAKTANVPSKINTATFTDEDGKFLIRKVSTETSTKLYVFSTEEEQVQSFTIKIEPGEHEFSMSDNSQPLELPGNITIESIEIEFIS